MIRKVLICFNQPSKGNEEYLQAFFNNFLSLEGETIGAYTFIYDKKAFEDEKGKIESNHYDALIVLCELTWEGHSLHELWGIQWAQEELCLNPNIFTPVLFVSFLSQEQILQREPHKKIIAAYALGYHFMQLPVANQKETERFYAMERVGNFEKEDAYHFASRKAMVSAIRHDVKNTNESLEVSKQRLTNLLQTAPESLKERASELTKSLEAPKLSTIVEVCNEIEPWFVEDYTNSPQAEQTSDTVKVLFLEDEKDLLDDLKNEAKACSVEILHHTKTSEALEALKDDNQNEIKVVVVDFRIWDQQDYYSQRMLEPQGYRFIEKVVAMGHHCVFISLSELPRMFLQRISSLSPLLVIPEDKHLVLSSSEQQKHFLTKLRYWDADMQERLKRNSFGSNKLFEFYKTLLSKKGIEQTISEESRKLIKCFDKAVNKKDYKPTQKLTEIETRLNELKGYKVEWNNIEEGLSDEQYIREWIQKMLEAFNNRHRNAAKGTIKRVLGLKKGNDKEEANDKLETLFRKNEGDIFKSLNDAEKDNILKEVKSRKKVLGSAKDENTFINKLIVRRFAIYLYYWIEKNFTDAKRIVLLNHFLSEQTFEDKTTKTHLTSKSLLLKAKEGKDIKNLKDIDLTFEEEIFFRKEYTKCYQKYIS